MRIVHLSDLHLGFRQFQRVTPGGINQREADVARAFANAVDKIIAIRPDVVCIAGDVFHTVRPTNPAILHAFTQFSRLTQELPETAVIMVAGNHDLPRSSETVCMLRLFSQLRGVSVADTALHRFRFPERSLSVLAVPELTNQPVAYDPDPSAKYNVLLAHAEVEGIHPEDERADEHTSLKLPPAVVASQEWPYIALGHYHVYRRVGPNAYYSGALEYASSSFWTELATQRREKLPGKGLIERDLDSGKQTFHPLPTVREFVDLPLLKAKGLSAAELDVAIGASVDRIVGGVDGKVVRLVVSDVPRHIVRELDHKALRDLQRRALHFQLDTRRPELIPSEGSGAPGRRPSLADTLRESLRGRELSPDIDRERLIELGMRYLADAEQVGAMQGQSAPDDES